MLRGQGVKSVIQWPLSLVVALVRVARSAASRVGVGWRSRSGRVGQGTRIDPSAAVVDSVLGRRVRVEHHCTVERSTLADYTRLGPVCIVSQSVLGEYSYASLGVSIDRAQIGRFCSIAAYAVIGATNHPMDRVTTHPFTYARDFGGLRPADDARLLSAAGREVIIGNDVWVGTQAVILPGVRIADGAVVGANSVVRDDVEPYQIVAGVPARAIRRRFDDRLIDQLLRIRWWEWSRELLAARVDDFADPERFVQKYGSQ